MTSESWPRFGFLSEPDDDEDDEEETSADSEGGWIQWFCRLEGHEFFCEVRENMNHRQIDSFVDVCC